MSKQVLSVGNCSFDFSTLSSALEKHFEVEMHEAETAESAMKAIKTKPFDLIVVNRLFDINQDSGIALIKKMKDAQVATPVMLISNFAEFQREAIAAGAVSGFGKDTVGKPAMIELVGKYLN